MKCRQNKRNHRPEIQSADAAELATASAAPVCLLTPRPVKRALARGTARCGWLAFVLVVAVSGSASAQGKLWLLGDVDLDFDDQSSGVQFGNWVPEVFKAIITDAQESSDGPPNVLIIWASNNDGLKTATLEAFASLKLEQGNVSDVNAATLTLAYSGRDRGNGVPTIEAADIVWLMDGTTEDYVKQMSGVVQDAIANHLDVKGGVVVGQGRAASLFGDVFLNESSSNELKMKEALSNKFPENVILEPDFLDLLPGTLIAPDFLSKGRLGRMPVILSRAEEEGLAEDLLGIGVDDATALRVDTNGHARVVGGGSVTFQHAIAGETVFDVAEGQTPHITDLRHHQLTAGYEYDLDNRVVTALPNSAQPVAPAVPMNAVYFKQQETLWGNSQDAGELATQWFPEPDGFYSNSDAIFQGEVVFTDGSDDLHNTVYATTFFNGVTAPTQVGTHLLALAENPGWTAIWVPKTAVVKTYVPATVENLGCVICCVTCDPSPLERSVLVLDSFEASSVAFSDYIEKGATQPRQSVAIEDARLHVVGAGRSLDLHDFNECELLGIVQDGDVNGDSQVNVVDVQSVIIAQGLDAVAPGTSGDLNCDGVVNVVDVLLSIQYALQAM